MMMTEDNHTKKKMKKRHNDYKKQIKTCIGIERSDAYKTLTMITLPTTGNAEHLVLMRKDDLR